MLKKDTQGINEVERAVLSDLADYFMVNKSSTLVCPAGEMTQAVLNSSIISKESMVGILDQNPISGRFGLPEFAYHQVKEVNADTVLICHKAYADLIEKNILSYKDIKVIKLFELLVPKLTEYIANDDAQVCDDRMVICKPRGGFNDMLCQIAICWSYAIEYKRKLYIDTRDSGFLDCFSNYFEPKGRVIFGLPEGLSSHASIYPKSLQGKIYNYKSKLYGYDSLHKKQQAEEYCYRESESMEKITFDFGCDYSEQVLVHEQSGRNPYSICALANLKLKRDISSDIKSLISGMGEYSATHIRNTDYRTDYQDFLKGLKLQLTTNILVCTDDYECKQFAKALFGEQFLSVSDIPNTQGAPLHENRNIERYRANVDALKDLFVLASAEKIYNKALDGLNNNKFGDQELESCVLESGFGILAKKLNADKSIIDNILKVD